MSERRRRRSIFDLIDELFREIWEEFDEIERRLMYGVPTELEERSVFTRPLIYGFRIEIGPDGKPRIYEFGNVKRIGRERPRIVVTEEAEPLTDVYEEDDSVRIIAELPGVDKEKIKVRAIDDRHIVIEASNHDRRYRKELELPTEVDIDTAKAVFRNGVLEIKIKKKRAERERGKIIEIE
ncbi:MAG TPA: Hsp20/alpha crystallin family protein [Ignisphaera sp.]|nr:Hsp20/alpha crystallin family protein [Ignisphaera sp.]